MFVSKCPPVNIHGSRWIKCRLHIRYRGLEHPVSRRWTLLADLVVFVQMGTGAAPPIPTDLSSEMVDFLRLTFELDCANRPSANELLRHPWILAQAQ